MAVFRSPTLIFTIVLHLPDHDSAPEHPRSANQSRRMKQ
jgi:hypothetical protein